jgi:cysteinyl-tRNA synthetase
MAIKLYDTLSGKKKLFKPRSGKKIEIFVCGPTVYDYSHIGHARTYIAFDAFVKYLRAQEYEVRYAQNITNIDDKIIVRSRELNQPPEELARNFETEYFHDMEGIKVDSVDKYARATDYIPQIISQVQRLMAAQYAYKIEDEGIYFDILKFKEYGKLSRRTVEQAEDAVSRIDESIKKRNKGDFVLWKLSKPGEPKWPSPWGDGRPGWHIEDTAITETEFGAQYDIHGGARDLMFPHHESEIAQMEAISARVPLVNYWMHTGFLTIAGRKMAKSLGNFITIHEFLREHSRESLRLLVLSSHYRSPIDYTEAAVEQAEANVKRLGEFRSKLTNLTSPPPTPPLLTKERGKGGEVEKNLYQHLDDDFNTPKALAVLFELIRDNNTRIAKNKLSARDAGAILEFLNEVNKIFGVIPSVEAKSIPTHIMALTEQREQLRKDGKWDDADKIRMEIEIAGYRIDDTPEGPQIKRA